MYTIETRSLNKTLIDLIFSIFIFVFLIITTIRFLNCISNLNIFKFYTKCFPE